MKTVLFVLCVLLASACPPSKASSDAGAEFEAWAHASCSLNEADEVSPDDCPADAWELSPTEELYRSLATPTDQDWSRFTFPAFSGQLDIRCSSTTPVELTLFDHSGVEFERVSGTELSLSLAPRAGSTFVRVTAVAPEPWPPLLDYRLVVEAFPLDDYPASASLARLQPRGLVTGRFEHPSDEDWFRWSMPSGRSLAVFLDTSPGFRPSDLEVEFLMPDGRSVSVLPASALVMVVPGEVAVRVRCPGDRCARDYPWQLGVIDQGTDDFSDSPQFANPMPPGDRVDGTLDRPRDADWLLLAPQDPTHFYRFEVTGPALIRALLYELDGSGVARNGEIYQGQPRARRLLVMGQTEAVGPWSVRVVDIGVNIDLSGDGREAAPLTVGTPLSGRFEVQGDRDAYAFDVVQDHFYSFEVVSEPAGLVVFNLFDTLDRQLVDHVAPPLVFRVDRSGRMAAEIMWWSPIAFAPYVVTVNDLGGDEWPDTMPLKLPTDGGVVTTALQVASDRDSLEFEPGAEALLDVRFDSTAAVLATAVMRDGRRLRLDPSDGASFGVRPATLSRIEFAPTAGALPQRISISARPATTPDDYDDDTPVPVVPGIAVYGRIDSIDDIDLFSFALDASVSSYRVHLAPGCRLVQLVEPRYPGYPRTIFDGHLTSSGAGTYLLRVGGDRCGSGAWGFTVTVP